MWACGERSLWLACMSGCGMKVKRTSACWAAQVHRVLGGVTSQHARQLLLARTSARYLGRLVAGLQQRGAQEAKFRRRGLPGITS